MEGVQDMLQYLYERARKLLETNSSKELFTGPIIIWLTRYPIERTGEMGEPTIMVDRVHDEDKVGVRNQLRMAFIGEVFGTQVLADENGTFLQGNELSARRVLLFAFIEISQKTVTGGHTTAIRKLTPNIFKAVAQQYLEISTPLAQIARKANSVAISRESFQSAIDAVVDTHQNRAE